MPSESPVTILAFDYGTRRIGVAMANSLLGVATPLANVEGASAAASLAAIAALIDEWKPAQLVVGLPTHADGTAHEMTQRARRFAHTLEARHGVPVALVDERWTSEIAESALRAAGLRHAERKQRRDGAAAQIILQAWLDEQR